MARMSMTIYSTYFWETILLLGQVHTNSKAQETWRGRLPGGIRGLQIRREVAHLSLVGSTPTLSAITGAESEK